MNNHTNLSDTLSEIKKGLAERTEKSAHLEEEHKQDVEKHKQDMEKHIQDTGKRGRGESEEIFYRQKEIFMDQKADVLNQQTIILHQQKIMDQQLGVIVEHAPLILAKKAKKTDQETQTPAEWDMPNTTSPFFSRFVKRIQDENATQREQIRVLQQQIDDSNGVLV